jgi:hypothetical protein
MTNQVPKLRSGLILVQSGGKARELLMWPPLCHQPGFKSGEGKFPPAPSPAAPQLPTSTSPPSSSIGLPSSSPPPSAMSRATSLCHPVLLHSRPRTRCAGELRDKHRCRPGGARELRCQLGVRARFTVGQEARGGEFRTR